MNAEKITVHEGGAQDRLALSAWRVMFRELWDYRELVRRLVSRNLRGQFRQSYLGMAWIALPPLAVTIVFTVLRQAQVVQVPMEGRQIPYVIFALVGTTLWSFFTQTTMMCTTSIAGAGSLVSKIYFPREILVLGALGSSLMNFAIRLAVVALTFALVWYAPHWQVVLAPLFLLPMLALALGLGLLLAPIDTMAQDTGRVLEFAFQFGMFLAPTVYPTPDYAAAATVWERGLYWLHTLNPVSHFIGAVHQLIERGAVQVGPGLIVATVLSFLVLGMGWRLFHIWEPMLAERL